MANSYLTRTPSSAGNRKTFTISTWVKRSNIATGSKTIFGIGNSSSSTSDADWFSLAFNGSTNRIRSVQYNTVIFDSNRVFRDTSAWYHIVYAVDTTQATDSNRIKIYINGVQETSFATVNYPSQNYQFAVNNTTQHMIGREDGNGSGYFDGYMSHVALVDGQALAPTVFGQTDSTSGIWKFKSPTGVTWGTNGFHLKFENSGNLGLDSSGNSNTFTVSGNGRQAVDTPSNVYATLNPLATSSYNDLTLGNNTVKGNNNANDGETYSTLGTSNSGKYYWEIKATGVNGAGNPKFGFVQSNRTSIMRLQNGGSGYGGAESGSLDIMVRPDGKVLENNSTSSVLYGAFSAGNILSFALDSDNGAFYYAINGTWQNSGNPASGASKTGAITSWTPTDAKATGGQHVCIGSYETASQSDCNFGNGYFGTTAISSAGSNGNGSLFEYDVPSGYYALNTKNINTYG